MYVLVPEQFAAFLEIWIQGWMLDLAPFLCIAVDFSLRPGHLIRTSH